MKKAGSARPPRRSTWRRDLALRLSDQTGPAGRVLLVDMDPQGHALLAAAFEHAQQNDAPVTLAALLTETPPPSIQRLMQQSHHHPNLFFIPSDRARMVEAARVLPTLMANETRLPRALPQVQNEFAYIIIDTPPNTGDLLINALVAADYVLIPVETSYLGVSGLRRTAAHHRAGARPFPPRPADLRLPAHPVRRAAQRSPGNPG